MTGSRSLNEFIKEGVEQPLNSETDEIYPSGAIAVIGLACRLPGDCNSPNALWDFLEAGKIASNEPPKSRFNLKGHYDGSTKDRTMRSPGGMFLENIDPQDIDAQFFGLSRIEANAMDPQQRQLLEVVYEGMENAGITMEKLSGQPFGCFVGSYAGDYADMQARDPEDRAPGVTVGNGRAMLSNRISHFLNLKGVSMTLDTACSGSLVALDVACRYINANEIDGAIVASCNLYFSPEHTMDLSSMKDAATLSGRCHTFDAKADGYVKAEAVNMVILKRFDHAIRDHDPIRAIIRGSATNSDGWTPGIASPNPEAQAAAIRKAYMNANISNFNDTGYLECHGTGTKSGDPTEAVGISSVFCTDRSLSQPLQVGSIKSNIGHSEPAAGISGLLKAILCLERGAIPGNPTFETPNPQIDLKSLKLRVSKHLTKWPNLPFRRASVNSFGYGGTNAHVVLDEASTLIYDLCADEQTTSTRPYLLVFTANDRDSLSTYITRLKRHLVNPSTGTNLPDLSYTLSQRRSHHFHRAYVVARNLEINESVLIIGQKRGSMPKIGFVFTGQGAQWSQMGSAILETFPVAVSLLKKLDDTLGSLPTPPAWSLFDELVQPRNSDHLRLPEFSQTLVTALQLLQLAVLKSWGIQPQCVVGHSSGEIAAACAAGFVTPEEAIKIAYYRGKSVISNTKIVDTQVGMLAVGLGVDQAESFIQPFGDMIQIGCINSPNSITLSGRLEQLIQIKTAIQDAGHFARLLQVNLAYHSHFMSEIAARYETFLNENCSSPSPGLDNVALYSSVTGSRIDRSMDATYWKDNMIGMVRFDEAVENMVSDGHANFLVEIGPSGALAGPITQIKKSLAKRDLDLEYCSASTRGEDSTASLFNVAGKIFMGGGFIAFEELNKDHQATSPPNVIVDLPNYAWNHSVKYWYESEASKDWRFRRFPIHDLLGTKIFGTSWKMPSWRNIFRVQNLPWLRDHRIDGEIVFPASAYIAMAVAAVYQTQLSLSTDDETNEFHESPSYRLRNVIFERALILKDDAFDHKMMLTLNPISQAKDCWYKFTITSLRDEKWIDHSRGHIRMEQHSSEVASKSELEPLKHPVPAHLWYKALRDVGYDFGTMFQKQLQIESVAGATCSRSTVDMSEPESLYSQSSYPMHPSCIDGCFQSAAPSLWKGFRSTVDALLVPAMIDDLIINSVSNLTDKAMTTSSREYVGVGSMEDQTNFKSNVSAYHPGSGELLMKMLGLCYVKLGTRKTSSRHIYTKMIWKPDVAHITSRQLATLATDHNSSITASELSSFSRIADIIIHKKPDLKVLEVDNLPHAKSSWIEESGPNLSKIFNGQYFYASPNIAGLRLAQDKYLSKEVSQFIHQDLDEHTDAFLPSEIGFGLVIIKVARNTISLGKVIENTRKLLRDEGYIMLMEYELTKTTSQALVNGTLAQFQSQEHDKSLHQMLASAGFESLAQMDCLPTLEDGLEKLTIATYRPCNEPPITDPKLHCVQLSSPTGESSRVLEEIKKNGWDVVIHSKPAEWLESIAPDDMVLVMDEIWAPVLSTILKETWFALQELYKTSRKILWVTTGAVGDHVTNPEAALINGLARTVRTEDPGLLLTTLDLETAENADNSKTIHEVLKALRTAELGKHPEFELVERGGILQISRVLPDEELNTVERENVHGAPPVLKDLHETTACVRLSCERLGSLDSLRYVEVAPEPLPLISEDFVEIEIYASGVNFKDIATTMGIVPENRHLLGFEGAGIVRRIGKNADPYEVGHRVLVYKRGTFANRVQVSARGGIHRLPDTISFEDAATLACVYSVSIYGLLNLASLQQGQSVLIHSAAGGVGIAAIQICQYMKATIYATVGTDEKRNYLTEKFNIPAEKIFSSRSTKFASELMAVTKGKGVDVIFNSLTGSLLEESWRCIASRGTMVEIGKRDILDRNSLSMEPFNRNASFRAIDMSHSSIDDSLISSILKEMFRLLEYGHIKPIRPIKIFSYQDIPAAFRYMRAGNHMGKIVISDFATSIKPKIQVRPAQREFLLREHISYLLVGGLKGICGSLAIYMARCGAKHLIALSRGGFQDEKSQSVIADIMALGCSINLVQGDVTILADVRRAFRQATVPIGGIIHGAMFLMNKPFESMTVQEFHTTLSAKVTGTWNLHTTSLESPQHPLEIFTLLSSISGIVGNPGQGNYAAANAFQDAFAAYRRMLSLPACSIALGAVEDVGYLATRTDAAARVAAWTVPISEALLHSILKTAILRQTSDSTDAGASFITGIAVPMPSDAKPARDARFSALCYSSTANSDNGSSGKGGAQSGSGDIEVLLNLVRGRAAASVVQAMAVEMVNRQFSKNMGLEGLVEPAKPLASYGLDSLAAIEIRNWIRVELRVELSTLEIINAESLETLCAKIVEKIRDTAGIR